MTADIDNRSRFPLRSIRSIVNRVLNDLEVNLPWVRVRVHETDHWHHHGHIYIEENRLKERDGLIIARVPVNPNGDSHDRKLRGGPPPIDPKDWREALLCIIAHEGTHLRQFLSKPKGNGYWRTVKDKRVYVSPRRFSEVEAEWAEYRFLKRYRERRT